MKNEKESTSNSIIVDIYEVLCIECGGSGCPFCNYTGKITVIEEMED